MTFNRYENQCLKCASHVKNTGCDAKRIADEWEMECLNDRSCHQDSRCDDFVRKLNGSSHAKNKTGWRSTI